MEQYAGDNVIACIVTSCFKEMDHVYTRDKMTVCFNLTQGVLRLFCMLGEKKDVLNLVNEFHNELKKTVDELYE